jgi:hypothetical protein
LTLKPCYSGYLGDEQVRRIFPTKLIGHQRFLLFLVALALPTLTACATFSPKPTAQTSTSEASPIAPRVSTSAPADSETAQLTARLQRERGYVSNSDACAAVWQRDAACSILASLKPITRPEWQELFPHAKFYILGINTLAKNYQQGTDFYGITDRRSIIAEQDGQLYNDATFDQLLKANQVDISDDRREIVAHAFALLTLGYYIESEIVLSDGVARIVDTGFHHSNYQITTWTRLRGRQVFYAFLFEAGQIRSVQINEGYGDRRDFTPVPWPIENTIPPIQHAYTFGNQ